LEVVELKVQLVKIQRLIVLHLLEVEVQTLLEQEVQVVDVVDQVIHLLQFLHKVMMVDQVEVVELVGLEDLNLVHHKVELVV
jgi:hypothetical protein